MPSETLITKKVLQHIRQITGKTIKDVHQPLSQAGIDSLAGLELVMDLEREFNISIPDEKLEQLKTVAAIVEVVQALRTLAVI